VKRLGEVIVAPRFESAHAIGGIAARGEEQHRCAVAVRAQRAAHAKAVDAGKHHIEHDERALRAREPRERLLAIGNAAHLVAFRTQIFHHPRGEVRIVLHDQHARRRGGGAHGRFSGTAAGQASTKFAPRPAPSLCALTLPPASSISRRTMKRPSPVP